MPVELLDVAPGLWLWRQPHPAWTPESGWEPPVVVVRGRVGRRADRHRRPRAAALRARRLGAHRRVPADRRARAQARPRARRRPVRALVRRQRPRPLPVLGRGRPEDRAAGDRPGPSAARRLEALYDGRGRNETPVWVPERRALVFADAMTAPGGALRVWKTQWRRSARCRRCARCSICRSSTCSSRTANRCTRAPTSRPRSGGSRTPNEPRRPQAGVQSARSAAEASRLATSSAGRPRSV